MYDLTPQYYIVRYMHYFQILEILFVYKNEL